MKKTHIIAIFVIGILIAIFVVSGIDSTTRADFAQASLAPGQQFNVSGTLNKEKDIFYDPAVNPNQMSFYMVDDKGMEKKVVLHKAKPQDFEKSEKIVLTGNFEGEEFHASSILMKCPSKYNEQNQDVIEYDGEEFVAG